MACTVCDEPVPAERIQLLARREDMSFLRIECPACKSTTLGFVAGPSAAQAPAAPERGPADGDSISPDDVLAMHDFLATWQGDPRALLDTLAVGREPRRGRPAAPR